MKYFFEEHKGLVLLIGATLILAIVIGVFAAIAAGEGASLAEEATLGLTSPMQGAIRDGGNWVSNLFTYFGAVKALREENEALRLENIQLDRRLKDSRGMELENQELRTMLDLKKTHPELELLAAEVTGKDPSNWFATLIINRGSDQGICEGQPVLGAGRELIGKISRVGNDWAEVVTILNPECGVGAIVNRTREVGVVEGDSSLRFAGKCRLGYLSRDAELEEGDYIETSGMGGVYPRGLLIGTVLEISEDNTNMSKCAVVQPMAELSKLRQVFVLLHSVEVISMPDVDPEMEDEDEDAEETPVSTPRPTPKATPKPTPKATAKPEQQESSHGQELRE
ncbi:MAG: rod shape-determining protein MreC [Clostridia bacterium]|nr:rod shape-determining protein MreC [Clostridia bacterium]